jgi:aspirochlorine biosynthesis cytochrome P450 monooxygenase
MSKEYFFSPSFALPQGSRIAFPTYNIHTDPDNYESPLTFNPYRFIGTAPTYTDRIQGTRITDTYLSFGYGKQACPGRFLAVKQLKLLMAKFFLEYEVQWAGGMDKAPKQLNTQVVEGQIFPDLSTKIEIRQRAS